VRTGLTPLHVVLVLLSAAEPPSSPPFRVRWYLDPVLPSKGLSRKKARAAVVGVSSNLPPLLPIFLEKFFTDAT